MQQLNLKSRCNRYKDLLWCSLNQNQGVFMSSTNSSNSTAINQFSAVMGATRALPDLSKLFQKKATVANNNSSPSFSLPPSVERAVGVAEQLVQAYQKLRIEVLDRTDRALWEMLEQVYSFVRQVESSPQKRDTRNELVRKIQIRDAQKIASNASIEAVAVRYIFVDQSRQTRNNYTIALEKARALEIPVNGFADFLAKHGGVGRVVETVFGFEEDQQATAKQVADAKAAEKSTRLQLVSRLYSAMAHFTTSELSYSGDVIDCVPINPKSDGNQALGENKPSPKYQKGNFVFFVGVANPETKGYRIVQGSVFDQIAEQNVLSLIADRIGLSVPELNTTVHEYEQCIGFGSLAANDLEELKRA